MDEQQFPALEEPRRPIPLNRPLAWMAAAFVAGVFAAAQGVFPGLAFPVFLLVCAVILVAAAPVSVGARIAGLLAAAFCMGVILWNVHNLDSSTDALHQYVARHPGKEAIVVEGRVRLTSLQVVNPAYHDFWMDADAVVERNKRIPVRGGMTVRWSQPGFTVFADDRVRVTGRASASLGHVNPGVSSFEDYLHRQGIHSAIRCYRKDAIERLAPGSASSPRYWASRLRLFEEERLKEAVAPSALPFVLAIWLGYGSTIAPDEYQSYIESGTVHILSVSGIHMVIVFLTATFAAKLFIRKRRRRATFVLVCILLFTAMSGMRPSALRSAVMILLYLVADFVDREPDSMTALSLSALVLVGWNPDILFDVGFLLSYLSVASMLLFGDFFHRALRFLPPGVQGAASTSFSVQILPTPLAIHVFHVFPLGAPLANLAVVPLSTAALWLSCMTTLTAFFSPRVALLFGHALGPVVGLIRASAALVSRPHFSHLTLTSPTLIALIAYYCAAGLFLAALGLRPRRKRLMAAAAASFVVAVALWRPFALPATVVFLDVGHGDATYIRSPSGQTVLVDGGDSNEFTDTGRQVLVPFLESNHATRLDYVALSHPDRDHIGGLLYLVRHFPVKMALLGPVPTDRPLEHELLQICAERGVAVQRLKQGDILDLGGMTLTALHPRADASVAEDVNNNSLVLRLDWLNNRVLLTGDIEARAEAQVAKTDCAADVLKAPHHGSRTSSSPGFLAAVHPRVCVVSTGGTSGHEPVDEGVLARYRQNGITAWRTDVYGGIALEEKNGGLLVKPTRRPE